jgi:hypothetical protein
MSAPFVGSLLLLAQIAAGPGAGFGQTTTTGSVEGFVVRQGTAPQPRPFG